VGLSDLAAWLATALTPATAGAGWILRRWGSGTFVARMRPHLVLGYAVLGLALAHVILSIGNSASANAAGIWCASLALCGLGLQTFSGTNLQSPGAYRAILRRWHIVLFWSIAALLVGHVLLNA
jgi:cytochrome b561